MLLCPDVVDSGSRREGSRRIMAEVYNALRCLRNRRERVFVSDIECEMRPVLQTLPAVTARCLHAVRRRRRGHTGSWIHWRLSSRDIGRHVRLHNAQQPQPTPSSTTLGRDGARRRAVVRLSGQRVGTPVEHLYGFRLRWSRAVHATGASATHHRLRNFRHTTTVRVPLKPHIRHK